MLPVLPLPCRRVPKMANMLEGGGKTPILSPAQLQEMGFKLVAYPLSLLAVSVRCAAVLAWPWLLWLPQTHRLWSARGVC